METPTAIPLVQVCMSCSSRQIILNQAREHNARLQKDMQALKDVLYRLVYMSLTVPRKGIN